MCFPKNCILTLLSTRTGTNYFCQNVCHYLWELELHLPQSYSKVCMRYMVLARIVLAFAKRFPAGVNVHFNIIETYVCNGGQKLSLFRSAFENFIP